MSAEERQQSASVAGKARASSLTPERRSEIARAAARASAIARAKNTKR